MSESDPQPAQKAASRWLVEPVDEPAPDPGPAEGVAEGPGEEAAADEPEKAAAEEPEKAAAEEPEEGAAAEPEESVAGEPEESAAGDDDGEETGHKWAPPPAAADPAMASMEAPLAAPSEEKTSRGRRGRRSRRQPAETSLQTEMLEARIVQAEARLDELNRGATQALAAATEAQSAVARAVQRVAEESASDARAQFGSLASKLQEQATRRFGDLETLADAGRSLNDEVSAIREQMAIDDGRVTALESAIVDLGTQLSGFERRLEAGFEARDRVAAEQLSSSLRAEREVSREATEQLIAPLESSVSDLRGRVETIGALDATVRAQGERVQLLIAERRRMLAPIEERITSLETTQKSLNDVVSDLVSTLESLEGQTRATVGGIDALEQGIRAIERSSVDRQTAIIDSLSKTTEAIARLQIAVADLQRAREIEEEAARIAKGIREVTIIERPEELVDINAATFEDLRRLGLSVTQAARMLALRESRGVFKSVEEIDDLSGVPSDLLETLKHSIRV